MLSAADPLVFLVKSCHSEANSAATFSGDIVVESVAVVDVGAALLLNKVRNSSVQTFFS